jgi:hypothetical protein
MATVTDLTGNEVTTSENTSVQVGDDSNVNVYEFGNLILADILPTIIWLINYIADLSGSAVSETDKSGDNSITYDFDEYSYDQIMTQYEGYPVSTTTSITGSLSTLVDISGS